MSIKMGTTNVGGIRFFHGQMPSWSSIGSNSITPTVRNLFYALANDTVEFGEFTLASTPTNAQVELFTLQNVTAPCNNIIFIDKDFYQGSSTLPHNSSEGSAFLFFSTAFLNPARKSALGDEYPSYGFLHWQINQTSTSGAYGGSCGAGLFNNSTTLTRGYWQWDGSTLKWRSAFGGVQYTTFIANRTYFWIAF